MMTVGEILDITDAKLLFGSVNTKISSFMLNSKDVKNGSCFVAIKGEKSDGNYYIDEAIENGAAVILSEKHPVNHGGLYGLIERIQTVKTAFILTEDIYKAINNIATYYRKKSLENVVAVTGSVGKTTVKEMIYSVLSEKMDIYKTEGNKNNLLGLPLSILSGNKSKNAVFELGISKYGEMKKLSDICAPTVSVITNIGSAHMEYLGSRENIANEKLKITCGMNCNGVLVINGGEKLLSDLAFLSQKGLKNIIFVSDINESADYFVCNVDFTENGTIFNMKKRGKILYEKLFIPVLGRHGALDAAFAVAVGDIFGCTAEEVRKGLRKYSPCGDRQRLECIDERLYLFDCYNASPESFVASLEAFKILTDSKGVKNIGIVAGSMLELGQVSKAEHKKIGKIIAEIFPNVLITVGREAEEIAKGATGICIYNENNVSVENREDTEGEKRVKNASEPGEKASFENKMNTKIRISPENVISFPDEWQTEALAGEIKKRLPKGAAILIKGSRFLKLEKLREYL